MSENSYWVPVTVLDKRIKEGWFGGRSYYITVKFLSSAEDPSSPFGALNPSVKELEANIENYHLMEIGTKQNVKMYRHSDGRLYTSEER